MTGNFPNDADGDALRRIYDDGSDPNKPMDIDFFVAIPDQKVGDEVARAAEAAGYDAAVEQDEESEDWTCYCSKTMLATYESVVAAQAELDALARPLQAFADGWGTAGNV